MVIVDRFEGEWAVLEFQGKVFNFPRELLPKAVKEGDVLTMTIDINPEETGQRKKRIRELESRLFKS